jgi:hypothetical protein
MSLAGKKNIALRSTLSFRSDLQNTLVPLFSQGLSTPTFTRATTATVLGFASDAVTGASPVLLTVASGEARFKGARRISEGVWSKYLADGAEINPANTSNSSLCVDAGGPFGYMTEAAATNICLQSEDFATTWTKSGTTVSADAAVAPDGTTTADEITFTTGAGYNSIYQSVTVVDATSYTASVFAKAGATNVLSLEFRGSGSTPDAVFDLSDGTLTSGTGTIEAWPNGWYKCSITETSVGTSDLLIIGDNSGNGGGTNTFYLWGAETKLGSFPTAYIPTTTTAVTRNTDALTYDDVGNISDAAGTAYCEASTDWNAATTTVHTLIGRTVNGRIIYTSSSQDSDISRSYDGSAVTQSPAGGTKRFNSPKATVTTWGSVLTAFSPAALLPDLTPAAYDGTMGAGDIGIGQTNTGTELWSGTIRNVKIFSNEKTASEVAAL